MNRPFDDRPDDPHDELTDRLAGSYRAQREEPPPMLDALILAKAKRAAEQRRVARLRALGASFALAATLVLGLALSLQVITTPEPLAPPDERAERMLEEHKSAQPVDRLLQPVGQLPVSPAPQVASPPPAAMEMRSLERPTAAAAAPAVAAPPAPSAPHEDAAAARARIAADLSPEHPDRAVALERVEVTGARAKRTQLEGASTVAPRSLEDWLAEVERLERDGESAEAAAMLVELCAAYPAARRCAKE